MRSFSHLRKSRHGLTLTDLCIVLAALLLLVAVVPALRSVADGAASRAKCEDNLKQIFVAMVTYANGNNGNYPRTYFARNVMDPVGPVNEYTGANAASSFESPDSPRNDVTGSIFLLLKVVATPPNTFVCPATDAKPYPDKVESHSNFPSSEYLSYSMQNPFPAKNAVFQNWQWNAQAMSTGQPLFSDMNPGGADLLTIVPGPGSAKGNSRNHGGAGQNVLYGDKAVMWTTTPFCGPERPGPPLVKDNIFTAQTTPPTVAGYPQDNLDAVLLPAAGDKAAAARP